MSLLKFKSIKPQNILIFNFYVILTIQLIFNWFVVSCNNHINIWKLLFLVVLFGRLVAD